MRRTSLSLICCLAALLAACGSRTDTTEGDSGLSGSSTTAPTGGTALIPTPESAMLGTMENPCSGGPLEGETPDGAVGVTDGSIRIGVISDRENDAVPLPTVGIEEAVEAFVEFCNAAGGINGRLLELETYDSKISAMEAATQEACRAGLLALVGTGSVQDQQAVSTREGCGLVEVAGYTATVERASSDLLFQPSPALGDVVDTGPCEWIAERHPEAVTRAAMLFTDLPAARDRAQQLIEACESQAGFEFVVERGQAFGDSDFRSVVADMKARDVDYFSMVSSSSETLAVLDEIEAQGLDIEVIDLGQQYYDAVIAAAPTTEGAYVLTNTVPFTETDQTPMLGLYRQYLAEIGADEDLASSLGVQSFSAGFLFATAAAAAGAELTRETLVTELEAITEWDGGGLHGPGVPGSRRPAGCFLYMILTDGEFIREHPAEGFACDPSNLHSISE